MILFWNDGESDSFFTGETCDIGYVWSADRENARVFDDAEDLGDMIEELLCDNFSPIKVEKK